MKLRDLEKELKNYCLTSLTSLGFGGNNFVEPLDIFSRETSLFPKTQDREMSKNLQKNKSVPLILLSETLSFSYLGWIKISKPF